MPVVEGAGVPACNKPRSRASAFSRPSSPAPQSDPLGFFWKIRAATMACCSGDAANGLGANSVPPLAFQVAGVIWKIPCAALGDPGPPLASVICCPMFRPPLSRAISLAHSGSVEVHVPSGFWTNGTVVSAPGTGCLPLGSIGGRLFTGVMPGGSCASRAALCCALAAASTSLT